MKYLWLSEAYWIEKKGKYTKRRWWHITESIKFHKKHGICMRGHNVEDGDFYSQWFKRLPKLKIGGLNELPKM